MAKQKSPLAMARFATGLTQIELADELGVTAPTISGWESDPSNMKISSFFDFYGKMNPRGQAILDQYLDDQRLFFVA